MTLCFDGILRTIYLHGGISGIEKTTSAFIHRDSRTVMMIVSTETTERFDVIYKISERIAKQSDVDICELSPLYETIDPDALVAFVQCSNSTGEHPVRSVEFSYCDYRVTVNSTGQVQLHPESDSTSPITST